VGGYVYHFGFALPFALAFDIRADGPRDAHPSRGLCSLCKRWKEETFSFGENKHICTDDLAGIIHRSGARRVRPQPRGVEEWPLEKVADKKQDQVAIDPWWDRQFV
jgi:hypothetical protein